MIILYLYQGIEFSPAIDNEEDGYILEQIDHLSKRHHQVGKIDDIS